MAFGEQTYEDESEVLLVKSNKLPALMELGGFNIWHGLITLILAFEVVNSFLIIYGSKCSITKDVQVGGDVNGIVPTISTTKVKFGFQTEAFIPGPNDSTVTTEVWDNWTALLPIGNGVIEIANFEDFPYLTDPIHPEMTTEQSSARYSTAWVHQLHCLFFVMKEYHRVLHHGPDGTEYFIDPTHNSYHASHCFNYLRQAILCGLDTTLEGAGDGSGAADGSGQVHVCKSRSESISWLESRRWDDTHGIGEL